MAKRVEKNQCGLELLMSGICEDTPQCIKITSKRLWKIMPKHISRIFQLLLNGKANQTEAWIQRSQEEIIESQRVYFHLILYCCLLAGICEVTAATSILRQRPIHCCCSVRQFTVCWAREEEVGINLPTHHDSFWCAPGSFTPLPVKLRLAA